MKFDWKDFALLLGVFISMNVMGAYVQGQINPMEWPQRVRSGVVFFYVVCGWFPVMLRRL